MDAASATATGVPATTLMRQWVIDRIAASGEGAEDAVVSVADLRRLIARPLPSDCLSANAELPTLRHRERW